MSNALRLFNNVTTKQLIQGAQNESPFSLPPFFLNDSGTLIQLNLRRAADTPTLDAPLAAASLSGATIKVAIGAAPTGTQSTPTPLAQVTLTEVTESQYEGTLNLLTAEMIAAIDTASQRSDLVFEIQITDASGNRYRGVQVRNVTVNACVIEDGSSLPLPATEYLTKAECEALFVKYLGDLGRQITLRSEDGGWGRVLGVDNDGNAVDDVVEY